MAKTKTTVDVVREYFQGIKYYEDEEKLIVILPEGLKGKEVDLYNEHLTITLIMNELDCIEFACEFKAPKSAKEILVLLAEDAREFDG